MPNVATPRHERIWQFKLSDAGTDSTAYFQSRAKEMAEALNYRLVSISQVTVKPNAEGWVSGKALVEGSFIVRKGGRVPKPKR